MSIPHMPEIPNLEKQHLKVAKYRRDMYEIVDNI
jgi:hypothetical protein